MTMPALPTAGTSGWDTTWAPAAQARLQEDQATTAPSVRTLGAGATQAAAGNHSHTAASETAAGVVELATSAETITGTSNTLAVHPAGLKAAQLLPPSTQSGTAYTFVLADGGPVIVEGNNASAITWTVPPNSSVAFPIGTQIFGRQIAAGQITIAAGAGVTVNGRGGALKSAGQWAEFVLTKRGTDLWVLSGDIST